MTAIPLGRALPHRLGATYPPAWTGHPSNTAVGTLMLTPAYLVLLRVEIARFTPSAASFETAPGLVSVALILTSRWTAVGCYAALCSPDLPPARPFGPRASGGLACFTVGLWSGQCSVGATNRALEAGVDGPNADFVNRSSDPAF